MRRISLICACIFTLATATDLIIHAEGSKDQKFFNFISPSAVESGMKSALNEASENNHRRLTTASSESREGDGRGMNFAGASFSRSNVIFGGRNNFHNNPEAVGDRKEADYNNHRRKDDEYEIIPLKTTTRQFRLS